MPLHSIFLLMTGNKTWGSPAQHPASETGHYSLIILETKFGTASRLLFDEGATLITRKTP